MPGAPSCPGRSRGKGMGVRDVNTVDVCQVLSFLLKGGAGQRKMGWGEVPTPHENLMRERIK